MVLKLVVANSQRYSLGFTLIELMVSLAIMGILATAIYPMAKLNLKREREAELRRSLIQIRTAIDKYKQAYDEGKIVGQHATSGYPANLEVLVEGVVDAKDPKGRRIYFLRSIPRDPFYVKPQSNQSDWALRSYDSPPDKPQAGGDVFDIHSKSTQLGLNGVPYNEW